MIKTSNLGLIPCIVLSIVIHVVVFCTIFYKGDEKQIFMQVPFDVSFYSPVQVQPKQVVEEKQEVKPVEKIVPKVEKKVEKKKVAKDAIVVKKDKTKKEEVKKEETSKEEVKKQEESVENNVENEGQQSVENGSVISSNKGIMLENKNFKYSYYTNTIVKKISKYWQWSSVTSVYRAIVYFKIAKDGTAYDVKIKESSSDENFDYNAMRAVELASPFAPLPSSYEEDYLGVYFEFKFH